jgi:hypothetical protein
MHTFCWGGGRLSPTSVPTWPFSTPSVAWACPCIPYLQILQAPRFSQLSFSVTFVLQTLTACFLRLRSLRSVTVMVNRVSPLFRCLMVPWTQHRLLAARVLSSVLTPTLGCLSRLALTALNRSLLGLTHTGIVPRSLVFPAHTEHLLSWRKPSLYSTALYICSPSHPH